MSRNLIEIPDYIICPMCKSKIKLERIYDKKHEKIRGIETDDIRSIRIRTKTHAGYSIFELKPFFILLVILFYF